MKIRIKELKENEPLKIIRVSNQGFPDRIKTKIFTDGEIEKEGETTSININNYYIKGSMSKNIVESIASEVNIKLKKREKVIFWG